MRGHIILPKNGRCKARLRCSCGTIKVCSMSWYEIRNGTCNRTMCRYSKKNALRMNVEMNPHQTFTFGYYRGISVCIRRFSGAKYSNCVFQVRQKWVSSWQISNYFVVKNDCEILWLVPIQRLLGMVDLVREIVYYVSEHFLDGAVRIVCLLRNCTCATAPMFLCLWLCARARRHQQVSCDIFPASSRLNS